MIHSYSYRPRPHFHPELPEGNRQLYLGLEIEVEFGRGTVDFTGWIKRQLSDFLDQGPKPLFYLKSDSSVPNGVEIVTHPFDPLWGLKQVPWDKFQTGIVDGIIKPDGPSTGQHIHMSKDAFSSSHLWKFLQLHHRLPDFCSMVGGRAARNEWGSFDSGFENQRPHLLETAKTKTPTARQPRYVAVNLQPFETLELRYPAGTARPAGIRKNIQWAKTLYDFTGTISVTQVRNGILDTPDALLWYIRNDKRDFTDLNELISATMPTPRDPASYLGT